METKIRLGISTCLLGENVRFDGGHKLDHFSLTPWANTWNTFPSVRKWSAVLEFPGNPSAWWAKPKKSSPGHHPDQRGPHGPHASVGEKAVQELEKEELYGMIFKSAGLLPAAG